MSARCLRVLFVNENIGGHATLHHHLGAALAARDDIDATIVDVPRPGAARRVLGAAVPGLGALDLDLQPLRAQLAAAWTTRRLLRAQDLGSFDALHVYSQNAALLARSVVTSMPSVVSTDSTNEVNARTLPYRRPGPGTAATVALTRRFEDPVLDAATMVVAQSEWIARSLRDDYGIAEDRLRIVRFGIHAPEPPPTAGPTVTDQPPRITFVGTTLARKGGDRLLRVFADLGRPARLTLVTREPVPAPVPGVDVVDDLTPGDPRLDDILRDTAVFAFPSEVDKSSYAVLEAMAHGAAVISTDVGALDELVVHGENGLLIPPGDDDALRAALVRLLDAPGERAAMGAAGRRRFEAHFAAERTTDDLVNVLREAVDRHGAGPRRR